MNASPRVLIVDDEPSLRRQLAVGLAQHGYEVDECEEGIPAIGKIKKAEAAHHPFGFVILDVRLPDIDGLKVLSVIKASYPELPVVVITGYGTEDTINTVLSCDASAYLDKPFEMNKLVSELDRFGPAVEEKPRPAAVAEPAVLHSALAFIRAARDADLSEMYSQLCFADGVCYCDPVVGDWDMVLLLQAPNRKGIDELFKRHLQLLKGVQAFELHHCQKPQIPQELQEFIRDYERARAMEREGEHEKGRRNVRMFTSYAVLEIEPSVLSNLYMKLYFAESVVHCDVTDGGRQVILLLQGMSAQEIQSVVRNEIRLMPGVLRIKQLNALNFSTK